MKFVKRKFLAVFVILSLAACGGVPAGGPGTIATMQRSTDPLLRSLITLFTETCLRNAPAFDDAQIERKFSQFAPGGVPALLSSKRGKSCRLFVRGYGLEKPRPTHGDLVAMATVLQSRVGNSVRAPSGGSIQVRSGKPGYNIFAHVERDGDLTFNVFN